MINFKRAIVSILLVTSILVPQAAFASNDISVYLDGIRLEFDVKPQLINDRTMVPLRAIFEALNATVEWNDETSTVTSTKGGIAISLTIGSNVLYKNGEPIAVDVPAQLVNNRTLVPVRVISEAFSCNVEWKDDTQSVIINSTNNATTFPPQEKPKAENSASSQQNSSSTIVPETNVGVTVYIGATGTKYHRNTCRTLKDTIIPISLEEAAAQGYTACKICY